jgi:hypothetical protein
MVRIIHQTGPAKIGDTQPLECWLLDGISYREGQRLKAAGWQWLKGPQGGIWTTEDPNAVAAGIAAGIPVVEVK